MELLTYIAIGTISFLTSFAFCWAGGWFTTTTLRIKDLAAWKLNVETRSKQNFGGKPERIWE